MTKEEVYGMIEDHYRGNFEMLTKRMAYGAKSIHNAEDIIQEAYTKALTYWTSYKEGMDFAGWFHVIINNATKDFFNTESLQGMSVDNPPDPIVSPSVLHKMELDEVVQMIEDQPERNATILRLFLLDDYNVKEIAAVVPESGSNIRKIVQRFREGLRDG